MTQTIKLKRTATPANVPTTVQLELGEVGINTYDGRMYIKKDNGVESIVEISTDWIMDGGDVNREIHFDGGQPSTVHLARHIRDGGRP